MGFNENLKAQLTYSGMSVKELSALSGINQNSLNNYLYERGQVPSIVAGVKIARALGISAESLVFGKESVKDEDDKIKIIMRLVRQLSEREKKYVIEALKAIVSVDP